MNEGEVSATLGLAGIPPIAEETMIARDIRIAEYVGAKIHIQHVSTAGSARLIREAKARGVQITAETCPHYIAGDESMVDGYDTATKVSPPLRSKADQEAIIEALRDGAIDCLSTDHAPHHYDEKRSEYQLAPNGISGFETAFALCYTKLVGEKGWNLSDLVARMTSIPASILGLPGGSLSEGKAADITLFKAETGIIRVEDFVSKGKNNPFDGWEVDAAIERTIVFPSSSCSGSAPFRLA